MRRILLGWIWGGFAAMQFGSSAIAQGAPVPDQTLGEARSIVTPLDAQGVPIDLIEGGAIRGRNLFHSFSAFNVSADRGTYFLNPSSAIQNILARVTGTSRSEILGTLGTLNGSGVTSRPNLFLLNPNGILFGRNASLDVGGSFVATTANTIQLGATGQYSASQPETSTLLSVDPSALLFSQASSQATIVNQATSGNPVLGRFLNPRSQPQAILPEGEVVPFERGLQVLDGKTLALVGGNILLDQSVISAVGGRLELGSVAGTGQVTVTPGTRGLAFGYDNISQFGKIELSSSGILASGSGGGEVQIQAAQLSTTKDNFFTGIFVDKQGNGSGSNLVIQATDSITLKDVGIFASLSPQATGQGGKILIVTPKLTLTGQQSSILTRNFSQDNQSRSGSVVVDAKELILRDGADITVGTLGAGNAGDLTVIGANLIEVSGSYRTTDSSGESVTIPGGLKSDIFGTGQGGRVSLNTRRLIVSEGAIVAARTNNGAGGSIDIHATESVALLNGIISTKTIGSGNAGNITIQTRQLTANNFGEVTASADFGSRGNGGNITVKATDSIEIQEGSGLIAAILVGAGDAGTIRIETQRLTLRNDGTISTAAVTLGRGGNIDITADVVEVLGGTFSSRITTETSSRSNQPSGDISIQTRQLTVQGGSQIKVDTLAGNNNAGRLRINASDSIEVRGRGNSRFSSSTAIPDSSSVAARGSGGEGGDVFLSTARLNILEGGEVTVSNRGTGKAGSLTVTAGIVQLEEGGKIIGTSRAADGGNIVLNVRDRLLLRKGSQISTTAGTDQAGGNGGNISLNSRFILAIPKEDSDITANAFQGSGGRITINSQGIFGLASRPNPTSLSDITASSSLGIAGTIAINSPDNTALQNGLSQLSQSSIDTQALLANSCIVRDASGTRVRARTTGTFFIKGAGGVPLNPSDAPLSPYPTGTVQPIPSQTWERGDPIVEPQTAYRLPDGKIIFSRDCSSPQ